ncbi:MAG: RING finger domain-containing protein [Promethearchaeota archaeon]
MPPANQNSPKKKVSSSTRKNSTMSFMDEIDAELAESEQKRVEARDKLSNVLLTDKQKLKKHQQQEYAHEVENIAARREKNGLSEERISFDTFDPGLDGAFDPVSFTQTLSRKVQQKKSTQAKKSSQEVPFQDMAAKLNRSFSPKLTKPSFLGESVKESTQTFTRNLHNKKSTQAKTTQKPSSQSVPFMDLTVKNSQKIPGKISRPSFLGKDEDVSSRKENPFIKSAPPITKPKTPTSIAPRPVPKPRSFSPQKIEIKAKPLVKTPPISNISTKTSSIPIPIVKQKTIPTPTPAVKTKTSSPSAAVSVMPSRKSPQCVICYSPITQNEGGGLIECLNDHPVHRKCLQKWIVHSDLCPVCSMPYSPEVLASFQTFKEEHADQKIADAERKKQEQLKQEQEELLKKINPDFTHKYNEADKLMKSKQYEPALKIFWDIIDQKYFPPKDQRILRTTLNIGLIYYRQGKHPQCIKQLMKIVKIDFNFPLAFYFLGLSYDQLGLMDKMKWALERALTNTEQLSQQNPKYQKFVTDIQRRLKIIGN